MDSDVWEFNESEPASGVLTGRVERTGLFFQLSDKNARLLRLLSEETISLIRGVLPRFDGEMKVENEGKLYNIKFSIKAMMKSDQRDVLLDVVGGTNSAFGKGIFGKLASVLAERAILANDNANTPGFSTGVILASQGIIPTDYSWAMSSYIPDYEEKHSIQDDGLEKSIIVNLADDCRIGVKSDFVEIVVTKNFA
jgi:hypothetical protein